PRLPVVWVVLVDHGQEGQGDLVLLAQPGDPLDLGVDRMPLVPTQRATHPGRYDLQHTGSGLNDRAHQGVELLLLGERPRYRFAGTAFVSGGAPERQTQRTRFQPVDDDRAHRLDVGRRSDVVRPVTHHVAPNGGMRQLGSDVYRARHAFQRV